MAFTASAVRLMDVSELPRPVDALYYAIRTSTGREGRCYVTGDDEIWVPRLDEQWIADRLNALARRLGSVEIVEARLLTPRGERLRPPG